jgi:diacylglycerol kinase family enzyme
VPGGFGKVRLGLLPLGTINVFARELGVPLGLMAAWQIILEGSEILVDLPRVEMVVKGRVETRHFLQLGGAGLDSRAISLVDWEAKKKLGPLAYILAGLRAMRGPQPLIVASDGARSRAGELVLLGNGRYYGGAINIFRRANLQDGRLHVCVFPKVNAGALCLAALGFPAGRVPQACGAAEFQAESVTLTSAEPVPLELDGDNVGELPAKFSLVPKGLRVLVPGKEKERRSFY